MRFPFRTLLERNIHLLCLFLKIVDVSNPVLKESFSLYISLKGLLIIVLLSLGVVDCCLHNPTLMLPFSFENLQPPFFRHAFFSNNLRSLTFEVIKIILLMFQSKMTF